MSENETKTEYIQLSEEELEKQWEKLNKDIVSACQKMSLEFITKHERDIEFNLLSVNPYLTYDIIKIERRVFSKNGIRRKHQVW